MSGFKTITLTAGKNDDRLTRRSMSANDSRAIVSLTAGDTLRIKITGEDLEGIPSTAKYLLRGDGCQLTITEL